MIFECQRCHASRAVDCHCWSDWQQAKEHPGLTEQRVREIVREEIARIVSALDDYSEDGIVRVSTLRDVLTRGRP